MKFKIEDLRLQILLFSILYSLFAVFTGCERNSTSEDAITFQGYVNYGHLGRDADGNAILIIDGALSNAIVTCETFPDTAKTATDGSYSLSVKTVRRFRGFDSETYTLRAIAPQISGRDEKITAIGKPGDTITVRSFVLYKHTEE